MGCFFLTWNWWRSAPNNPQPYESGVQDRLTRLSTGDGSTAVVTLNTEYGAMGSPPHITVSTPTLSIPRVAPLRTENTNVSPSSIRSFNSQRRAELKDFRSDGGVQDLVDVGSQFINNLTDRRATIMDGNLPLLVFGDEQEEEEGQSEEDAANGIVVHVDPKLEDKLWDARVEWPKGENRHFIPAGQLRSLITVDSVRSELRRCQVRLPEAELQSLVERIVDTARKLFAILVCQDLGKCICSFLEEGLDDKDLPFVRSEETGNEASSGASNFKLRSRRYPQRPIRCMAKWARSRLENFGRDQWWVLAPIFKESREKKVRHWELENNCVLPFVEDQERTKATASGFSSVWGVQIHPDHQFLYRSTQKPNPWIALKRLHSTKEEDFLLEVEMLKAFSNHQHPHLVKLLATFRLKGRYYLMFPFAAANLRTYWEITPTPQFTFTTMKWSLTQCKGIASGLLTIHEYKTTNTVAQSSEDTAPLVPIDTSRLGDNLHPSPPVEYDGIYGRHGDIKPENILWSDENVKDEHGNYNDFGLLLIADFGLMDFHGKNTRSIVPFETITGSPTYEPPERRLRVKISRAYDIWSLGCVYLEFITWLVTGYEELSRFPTARGETGLTGINDDTFFTLVEDSRRAIVRPSVTEWIQDLREKPRCSQFIQDFLDIVSKHMLVIDPQHRIQCGPLNKKLMEMCDKSSKNADYLTGPVPLPTRMAKKDDESPPPSPTEGRSLPKRDISNTLNAIAMSPPQLPISCPTSPTFSVFISPLDGG